MLAAVICVTGYAPAQKTWEKKFPVKSGQSINLQFGFPKISISTWDSPEVSLKATVNINGDTYSDAYSLASQADGSTLSIKDTIKDLKNIPPMYYVESNGIKKKFESKSDYDNYRKEHKDEIASSYSSRDMDIQLEIRVPAGFSVNLHNTYGLVALKNYNGTIRIDAKYGGIDAALTESKVGQLKLTNHYGKIYSNLKLKPTEKEDRNFYTSLTATPGSGPAYDFSSNYGNIYVRKAN